MNIKGVEVDVPAHKESTHEAKKAIWAHLSKSEQEEGVAELEKQCCYIPYEDVKALASPESNTEQHDNEEHETN